MDPIVTYSSSSSLQRGERFMRLLLANQQRIYGLILALVPNWNDADDIMQETSAVMWAKFDDYEAGTDFAAWGLRIARYQVMAFLKKQGRERRRFSDATLEEIADQIMAAREELDDRRDAVQQCLGKLPERDRQLIQLRYEPDATTKSAADRTGRSVHAVYKALNRIHGQLLDCIRQRLAEAGV